MTYDDHLEIQRLLRDKVQAVADQFQVPEAYLLLYAAFNRKEVMINRFGAAMIEKEPDEYLLELFRFHTLGDSLITGADCVHELIQETPDVPDDLSICEELQHSILHRLRSGDLPFRELKRVLLIDLFSSVACTLYYKQQIFGAGESGQQEHPFLMDATSPRFLPYVRTHAAGIGLMLPEEETHLEQIKALCVEMRAYPGSS